MNQQTGNHPPDHDKKPPRDPARDIPLIQKRIASSRGFQFTRIQGILQYSRFLHFKNYGDLAPLLQPISKPEAIKALMPMGGASMHQFVLEVVRRLVNYLNSSCYLVDHARFLVGRLYDRRDRLYAEITQRLDSTYFGSACPELIRGFRHTAAHVTLPMVMTVFSFENMHLEIRLNLDAWREAANARDWKKLPHAREYLAAQKENPSIYPIIKDYHEMDAQFFQWLESRQRSAHVADLAELERLRQGLRAKYQEAGINPDELGKQ